MKLQGISEKGISRIARVMKSQDLGEPDYGEHGKGYEEYIKESFEKAGAEWTSEGWVVEGDLDLSRRALYKLPKFKFIGGDFICYFNSFESLEGAPREVGGDFICYSHVGSLKSFNGAPEIIGGDFDCSYNNLTSLEGAPREVGGDFICKGNKIDFTEEDVRSVCNVGGQVITELDPVSNEFDEFSEIFDQLDSEKTPDGWVVNGDLDLSKLKMQVLPKIKSVSGNFYCWDNELESLEGAPEFVGGDFDCSDNPGRFTEEDVRAICEVVGEVFSENEDYE